MFDATVVAIYISSNVKVYLDDLHVFGYNIDLELQNVDPYLKKLHEHL